MFFECSVWQLNGIKVPRLNDHPGAVSVKGFAQTNAIRDAPVSNLLKILLSSIDQRALIPAIRSKEFWVMTPTY